MGDIRCGWVLAEPELAKIMRRIIDYTNVEGVFLGEEIAYQVFCHLDGIKRKNRKWIGQNRAMLRDFISREKALCWVEPAEGGVCFLRKDTPSINGDILAELLRSKYETAIVPGSFFEQSQHFRLGFGVSPDTLAAGL